MAQFCTRCGKPLQPGVRFCPSCGGAVAAPAMAASNEPVAPPLATFSQPSTSVMPPEQASSPSIEGAWATVTTSADSGMSQAAEPVPFAPVEAPAYSPSASGPSQSKPKDWATVTPASDQVAAATGQPGSFAPVPVSNGPAASTSNAQWSQPAAAANQTGSFVPVPVSSGPAAFGSGAQWSQPPAAGITAAAMGTAQPPQRRSVWPKLIGAALVFILLVGVVVVGGVIYVGYKVRQKTRAVTANLSQLAGDKGLDGLAKGSPDAKGALAGLFGALAGKAGTDGIPVLSSSDAVIPCTASPFPAQDKARVPFKPGTVITTAWGIKYGDVESRITVDSIDGATMATTNHTGEYKNDNGAMARALTVTNQNCNSDYLVAGNYITVNAPRLPTLMHDLTRFRLSDKVFQGIQSNGQTNFSYLDVYNVPNGVKLTHQAGVLTRVEPQDVKYPMIVNDQRVDLPAIHMKGLMTVPDKDPRPAKDRPKQSEGELFVLDDPADPLVLNWRLKDPLFHNGNFRVEVIKINFPVAKPVNVLEKQLVEQKRAVTYGIYFDFNKDTLKPESEPVLKEIAQTMQNNPDWKLTVEGHTDNVGLDNYNLELSQRRAAAVKRALVSQYNIAPERLLTGGFGASRPIAPNDTLEGRARNRRVELVRE